MGDVKDILMGNAPKSETSESTKSEIPPILGLTSKQAEKPQRRPTKKPAGMSREVFALIGSTEDGYLPGMVPSKSSMFKEKRDAVTSTKWIWTTFQNSARTDGVAFHHWQKVGVDTPDYPYAKYNVKLDRLQYTDLEYRNYLEDPEWSQRDTNKLLQLCHKYDLRWPVIFDRFNGVDGNRPVEQLMARYYTVVKALCIDHPATERQGRAYHPFSTGGGPDNFNFEHEQKRRLQLELQFKKTKAEEKEEEALREELKQLDQQLRQLRKQTKDNDSSKGDDYGAWVEAKEQLDAAKPYPKPKEPYLQSQRIPPMTTTQPPSKQKASAGPQLSKTLMKKMQLLLAELSVPEKPLATRRVADLLDLLKRDLITLLTLKKIETQKKYEVAHLAAQHRGKPVIAKFLESLPSLPIPEVVLPYHQKGRSKAGPPQGKQKAGQKRAASKQAGNKGKRVKKTQS